MGILSCAVVDLTSLLYLYMASFDNVRLGIPLDSGNVPVFLIPALFQQLGNRSDP